MDGQKKQFDWVEFYQAFAWKLLDFHNNRQVLVDHIRQVYQNTGIAMPTLERDQKIVDIDPFTVFGLFNKSSQREDNRKKIIASMAELFDISAALPTSFVSVPVLNNQNATFYDSPAIAEKMILKTFGSCFPQHSGMQTIRRKQIRRSSLCTLTERFKKEGTATARSPWGYIGLHQKFFSIWISETHGISMNPEKSQRRLSTHCPLLSPKIPAEKYFAITEKIRAYLQSGTCPYHDFMELSAGSMALFRRDQPAKQGLRG